MKHFRLRGDALGVPVCSVVLAVALQSALGLDIAPTVFAQSPTKQPTQPRPQKVANPLNDLLDQAQRNIDSNNFESAIAPLQKFITEKPDVAFAHFQLGYTYTAQRRPRSLLAVAQDRSGDQEAAARSFEGVLHLDPNDLTANRYLGDLDLRRGKPAQAEARFRHALEIRPDAPEILQGLAQSLEAQNKPEAADVYRKYLVVVPGDSPARAHLVHLLLNVQEYDAALAELDRADAGKPPSADSLRMRADIQIAQKKWD